MEIREHLNYKLSREIHDMCKAQGIEIPETEMNWCWTESSLTYEKEWGIKEVAETDFYDQNPIDGITPIPAPSLAELGEMLPEVFYDPETERSYQLKAFKQQGMWWYKYHSSGVPIFSVHPSYDSVEVDLRGMLLSWVIMKFPDAVRKRFETLPRQQFMI